MLFCKPLLNLSSEGHKIGVDNTQDLYSYVWVCTCGGLLITQKFVETQVLTSQERTERLERYLSEIEAHTGRKGKIEDLF